MENTMAQKNFEKAVNSSFVDHYTRSEASRMRSASLYVASTVG